MSFLKHIFKKHQSVALAILAALILVVFVKVFAAPATPLAPTNINTTPGSSQVSLSWTAGGGAAADFWAVDYKLSSSSTWINFSSSITTTSATVTGLTNGQSYDFRITGLNTTGPDSVNSKPFPYDPDAFVLRYGNLAGGTFSANDTITGSDSLATATVLTDNGLSYMTVDADTGFNPGTDVLDNGSGVTADLIFVGNNYHPSVTVSDTPNPQPFSIGETLDPACAPGAANCFVDIPTGGHIGDDTEGLANSVLFVDSSGNLAEDNSTFFYNATSNSLNAQNFYSSLLESSEIQVTSTLCIVGDCRSSWPGASSLIGQTDSNLTILGHQAGNAGPTGGANTFVGVASGYSSTSGNNDSFFGSGSGQNNDTGGENTFIGTIAGYANTSGGQNTGLGKQTLFNNSTGSRNVAIGYQAGYNETGSDKLYIANSSTVTPLIYGDFSSPTLTINGNVGIGTTAPEFRLTIDKGAATPDGGILAIGTYGSGTDLTTTGEGARMIWYPKKAAFRAGRITGFPADRWNDANIGIYSTAFGYNPAASGEAAVALGFNPTASGNYSMAAGFNATASGPNSVALGYTTTASGGASTAFGNNTVASNNTSTAFGSLTTASGLISTAFGQNIEVSGSGSVGIGLGVGGPFLVTDSNVFSVMGGNVGIGTTTPISKLSVVGLPTAPVGPNTLTSGVCADDDGNFWLDQDGVIDCQ